LYYIKTVKIMKTQQNLNYGVYDKTLTGIYKIEINEHIYIGSASKGFEKRWKLHLKDLLGPNSHHSYKMQKYFDECQNINFSIIELCEPEKCIEREQYYIDTLKPDMNISPTAGSSLGIKRTDETKEKCRQAKLGTKLSKESIEKRTAKLTKKVYQYDLNGVFIKEWNSIKEAGETLNISRGNISKCSNGKMQYAGNFIWTKELIEVRSVKIGKSILQYTLENEFIKEWDGISQIEQETNFKRNNIYENLREAKTTAYGFIWKYNK